MGVLGKGNAIFWGYFLWLIPGIIFPAHRIFFNQKWVLRALTLNWFFIGWLIDMFMIPKMAIDKDNNKMIRKAQLKKSKRRFILVSQEKLMKKKSFILLSLLALLFILLMGCATTIESNFVPLEPSGNNGVVYIYRPTGGITAKVGTYQIGLDGKNYQLNHGEHYALELPPGSYDSTFTASAYGEKLTINVSAKEAVFVECSVKPGLLTAFNFMIVDNAVGEVETGRTKRIN